eukprot:1682034-Amphidinium_carterae.1
MPIEVLLAEVTWFGVSDVESQELRGFLRNPDFAEAVQFIKDNRFCYVPFLPPKKAPRPSKSFEDEALISKTKTSIGKV